VFAHLYVVEDLAVPWRGIPAADAAARAATGDREAFGVLVTALHSDLLRVAYVIVGDAALAEDAAQSAWTKAWKALPGLREPSKLKQWLIAITANEARQLARRRPLERLRPGPHYASDADPSLFDLAAAIERLSMDDRQLIALRYALELSSPEIAEVIGVSPGAVRSRLVRLLRRLRSELHE
jgi:RNA polymerase sigma-70 factor (ECF subfamily)